MGVTAKKAFLFSPWEYGKPLLRQGIRVRSNFSVYACPPFAFDGNPVSSRKMDRMVKQHGRMIFEVDGTVVEWVHPAYSFWPTKDSRT